ncbi:MAG: zinc-binding dehydrogenase [Gemmatimonadota bacterium]|nr:MAG: zinc-binding dehydrogenase [Gemmatimonadota bacterium]
MPIKAAVMTGPEQAIELWQLDDPKLEPGSILLETVASEVCGTDVHIYHGRLAGVPYPIIPGHISVGRVLETRGVEADSMGTPLAPGDLVTFYDVHETCHACYFCTVAGQPNRCPSRRVYGITYSAHDGPLGGWAERIYLKPGVQTLKLPEPLTADDVIGGGCGLFTGFAAVERSDLGMGDTVLVQGTGPVGLSAIAFSALRGAATVVTIGDPAARLELASAFGADVTMSLSDVPPDERDTMIRDLTNGRGVDVALECAGNPAAIPEGFKLLRDGGTYVIAGHYTDVGEATINPHIDINRKHADVRGRWGLDFSHCYRALRLLAKHHDMLPFARVIGGRYSLDEAGEALADVEALAVTKAIIAPSPR